MKLINMAFQFATNSMHPVSAEPVATRKVETPVEQTQETEKSLDQLMAEARFTKSQEAGREKQEDGSEEGYSGFLHIKCEHCDNVHTYCSKERIRYSKCRCNHTTPLKDLRPLYAECKCGNRAKYLTNITDDISTITCINCGSPIDVTLNERRNSYATLKDSKHHGGVSRSVRKK